MAISIQLRDGMIESVWRGTITLEDIQHLLKYVEDRESNLPVAPDRLMDLSPAQVLDFRSSDLIAIAQLRHSAALKNKVKSAIVAPSPEQFGLARMFQAYNQNPAIHLLIFRESLPAYEWLGVKPNSHDQTEA